MARHFEQEISDAGFEWHHREEVIARQAALGMHRVVHMIIRLTGLSQVPARA